jgi:hypothetical protein
MLDRRSSTNAAAIVIVVKWSVEKVPFLAVLNA